MGLDSDNLADRVEAAVLTIRGGSVEAFEVIVRGFQEPVRVWLAGRAFPGMDLDGLAQQIFWAVYRGLARYEAGTDFRAWFFAVARYQLMAELSRYKQESKQQGRFAAEFIRRQVENLEGKEEEGVQHEETLARLRGCVEKLDAGHRELVFLRHTEGKSLEEISERTGRSVGAMKKQFWKIRLMLRKCLEQADSFLGKNGPGTRPDKEAGA